MTNHPDPFAEAPAPDPAPIGPRPPTPPVVPYPLPTVPAGVAPPPCDDLGDQPDIVPWGPPGSGKTTLLATMLYMLRRRVNNPQRGLYYDVEPRDDQAREMLDREVGDLVGGKLPPPTRFDEIDKRGMRSKSFLLGFRDRGKNDMLGDGLLGHFHRLAVMDAAGEETNPNSPYSGPYWQRLRGARGVLVVINGSAPNRLVKYRDGTERTYGSLLEGFLDRVRQEFRAKPYLAICLTQADAAYGDPGQTYQTLTPEQVNNINRTEQEPKEHFIRIVGRDAHNALEQTMAGRFRIFLTSATGWHRDERGNWCPNVTITEDGPRLLSYGDNWWPVGALYPLMWLFDEIEEDRFREKRRGLLGKLLSHAYKKRITNQKILQEKIDLPPHHRYWL